MPYRPFVLSVALLAVLATRGFADDPSDEVSFRRDIAPLLLDYCLPCHGPKKAEGGYRIDTFARAAGQGDSEIPGFVKQDLEGSEAYRRIVSDDEDERMPAEGDPLPKPHVELFRKWIEQGAKFDGEDPDAALASIIPAPTHPAAPESYPHTLPITALAFSPDGKQLIASGYHELTVWNAEDGTLAARIGNLPQRTLGLAFSPDGKLLAAGGGNPGRLGEVRLLEMPSGKLTRVVGLTSDVVRDVAFSDDGKRLASAASDEALRLFDPADGKLQATLSSHSDWITAVAFSRDGKQLATSSRDKTAKVFDVEKGELVASYGGHGEPVNGVAFSADGKQVYSSGEDRKLHRWTIADAKKQAELGLGGEVFKLMLEGDVLLASSADRTVRRLQAGSFKEVRKFEGTAPDWVLCTAYHADSKRLVGGCFNGQVVVWNAEDGKLLKQWTAAPGR